MEEIINKLKLLKLPINFRKTNRKYINNFINKKGGSISNIIYSLPIYLKDVEKPVIIKEDKILINYYLNVIKNGEKEVKSAMCEKKINNFSKCLFKNRNKISFVPISINEKIIKNECGNLNRCSRRRIFN